MLTKNKLLEIEGKYGYDKVLENAQFEALEAAQTALAYRAMLERLTTAYDEYAKALTDELGEIAGLACAHGWQSKRGMLGEELRHKIAVIKKECGVVKRIGGVRDE